MSDANADSVVESGRNYFRHFDEKFADWTDSADRIVAEAEAASPAARAVVAEMLPEAESLHRRLATYHAAVGRMVRAMRQWRQENHTP
jgi:hypothetical protein